jgi:hypothetical protein
VVCFYLFYKRAKASQESSYVSFVTEREPRMAIMEDQKPLRREIYVDCNKKSEEMSDRCCCMKQLYEELLLELVSSLLPGGRRRRRAAWTTGKYF